MNQIDYKSTCDSLRADLREADARNKRLSAQVKFANQSKSVTIQELEVEVDQLKELTTLLQGDLATAHRGLANKRAKVNALCRENQSLLQVRS